MVSGLSQPAVESTLIPLRQLLRDFSEFAGAKGLHALLFVFLGAIVEGVSLVLLVPFFSVIIDSSRWSLQKAAPQSWACLLRFLRR